MIPWHSVLGGRRTQRRSFQDEKEPHPPTDEEIIRYITDKEKITKPEILSFLRNKMRVLGGARAMNQQLPKNLRRKTDDWDVASKNAEKLADKLEDELDSIFGSDMFYIDTLPINYAGSPREGTIYRVISRADEEPLVEVHKPPEGQFPPYIVEGGIKYETLKSLRDKAIKILRDRRFKYRWSKTRQDMKRMEEAVRR